MVKEIYISIDVEADGPRPGDYSMTSLGAVVAGYQTSDGEIVKFDATEEENRFYSEIRPISDDWVPAAMTVGLFNGWDKERADADPTGEKRREWILIHGEDPQLAMTRFADWVQKVAEKHDAIPVFAAYPLGFDWMFTYWYLSKFSSLGSPFSHGRHIDIKTEYAAKANALIARSTKRNIPKKLHSKLPHTHLAVDDAAEQGELLMNILMWEGKNPHQVQR